MAQRLVKLLKKTPKDMFVFGGLALLVLGPLLVPGFILTLDMVFVPEIAFPNSVSNLFLPKALMAILNVILPSYVIQKILLFITLWVMGVGMFRLVRHIQTKPAAYDQWGAYLAGVFYMVNPYTYARFMAGQYWVLLGYALLPFFTRSLLQFLAKPDRRSTLVLSGWAVLIGMVSIHTLGLIALITLLAFVLKAWRNPTKGFISKIGKYGLVSFGVFVLGSSYWLIPLLAGSGETAETLARFGAGDQQAFATTGGDAVNQIGNVLQLQGFWAEAKDQFLLPQHALPGWTLVVIFIWALVILGGKHLWRMGKRFEVKLFGLSALAGLLLSLSSISGWLFTNVPFFAGYREPHKFVGLVALMYALFAGQGAVRLMQKYHRHMQNLGAHMVLAGVLLIFVPFTPTMFWGFGRQLHAVQYPPDWQTVNKRLNRDPAEFQVLFLPWHLYMHFDFAGRLIANPAPRYFDKPVIISDDPEFDGVASVSDDPVKQRLDDTILPAAPRQSRLGAQLASLQIKYILLSTDYESDKYRYLDAQQDLQLIQQTHSFKLYYNKAFK